MTKYVLNSGGIKSIPDLKAKFHQEVVKGLGSSPHILLCNFAQAREYWESRFEGYTNSIIEDMPEDIHPTFVLAFPAHFPEQCERADIIYIHGGDDHLLQYWMRKFNLETLFQGKVVATNSASSNMLASHYWTCDWRECNDGFGILPIKFIPHFHSSFGADDPRGPIDWDMAKTQLSEYGDPTLPIHALKEGEFVIIER